MQFNNFKIRFYYDLLQLDHLLRFELLLEWYVSKNSAVDKSANVENDKVKGNVVTSDTTDTTLLIDSCIAPSTSINVVVTIEECESMEVCFTSSFLI